MVTMVLFLVGSILLSSEIYGYHTKLLKEI